MSNLIERLKTNARMSHVVIANDVVYLSGQLPNTASAPFAIQVKEILARIDSLLEYANVDRTRLLTANVWISTPLYFDAFNEIWDAWVPEGHAPTRVCVTAALMRPGLDVEIAVNALK
ncbi:RidA family protein (plasmid) [Paraburkholderia strydomiana]